MKYYIVKWLNKEHHLTDEKESIICAKNVAIENKCNSYVFIETTDGIREEEPFFKCEPPYSKVEYEDAKRQGLDLDDWNDYEKYWGLGEEPNYDDM